jgi:hypothetical protein
MTTVNVSAVNNTVVVAENGTSTVVTVPQTSTVTAITQGPQGPAGANFEIDSTAKVDKSIVYYDAAADSFKADTVWTTNTLVDGANF